MMLASQSAVRAVCKNAQPGQYAILPTPIPNQRVVRVRASAASEDSEPSFTLSRRAALLAVPAGAILLGQSAALMTPPAFAGVPTTTEGFKTLLGYSQAPDLYLGYGASKDAPALYSFEYPVHWEESAVTKTDKSTMGMDSMVKHPKTRKEQAYVIALGGKDYRDSVLKDAKTSLTVIAGSDPDLRQAVTDGQVKQVQRTINGTPMYMYEISSDKRTYLSTIGKKGDTVFALVVTAPNNAFDKDAEDLRHIQDTFKVL